MQSINPAHIDLEFLGAAMGKPNRVRREKRKLADVIKQVNPSAVLENIRNEIADELGPILAVTPSRRPISGKPPQPNPVAARATVPHYKITPPPPSAKDIAKEMARAAALMTKWDVLQRRADKLRPEYDRQKVALSNIHPDVLPKEATSGKRVTSEMSMMDRLFQRIGKPQPAAAAAFKKWAKPQREAERARRKLDKVVEMSATMLGQHRTAFNVRGLKFGRQMDKLRNDIKDVDERSVRTLQESSRYAQKELAKRNMKQAGGNKAIEIKPPGLPHPAESDQIFDMAAVPATSIAQTPPQPRRRGRVEGYEAYCRWAAQNPLPLPAPS